MLKKYRNIKMLKKYRNIKINKDKLQITWIYQEML